MTASSTPSTTAIAIAMTVSSIVTTAAAEIRWSNRYLPYVDQSYASLVAAPQANRNRRATRMPALIQRPGRRSGTALMGVLLASVMGSAAGCPVDLRRVRRAVLEAPVLEDLLVGAVVD